MSFMKSTNRKVASFLNRIASSVPFVWYEMSNGLKLVHQKIESPVAFCALMINAGSRDEMRDEYGAAHLMEHLMFKETGKRKAHHILSRMENVGGELNAYTTKEDTCIYAAFLNQHYARSLELFTDIVFNHRVTDKLFQLEKSVVIDEIKSSKDSPLDVIFDEFDELLFPDHPLGRNTLGTIQSVNRLEKAAVESFAARNCHPNRMVLTSVGNIHIDRLIAWADKYFGGIPANYQVQVERAAPDGYAPFKKATGKRNHQSHCIMGTTCESATREFRIAMSMLANLLGGPGMNTRLNMSLRERNGWVYHVEATYTPYSDVGVFNIYFATDKSKIEKCVAQIEKELDRLKKEPLTADQLKRLQMQMMGQMAIASDNNDVRMLSAGKSLLMFEKIDDLHDLCITIDQTSAEYLCEIAKLVFSNLSVLTYQ